MWYIPKNIRITHMNPAKAGFFCGKNMTIEQNNFDLEVIAGPCSINPENIGDIYEIADIRVRNQAGEWIRGISGTRIVGLKSRTTLSENASEMGMDYPVLHEQMYIVGQPNLDRTPPSVPIAQQINKDTDLLIATEVMVPHVQAPHYVGKIPKGKLLLWNPAVDQLGWHVGQNAAFARQHGWLVGIKNGKTLGTTLAHANSPERVTEIELERTWAGLATFANGLGGRLILIHRGVEDPEKGDFRSALVHEVARRVKRKVPSARLFFDPSHSYGPKLRDQIVEKTVEAMRMEEGSGFLYDGILIEAGHSETDAKQHITINELRCMAEDLSKFRKLKVPLPSQSAHTSTVIYPAANPGSTML